MGGKEEGRDRCAEKDLGLSRRCRSLSSGISAGIASCVQQAARSWTPQEVFKGTPWNDQPAGKPVSSALSTEDKRLENQWKVPEMSLIQVFFVFVFKTGFSCLCLRYHVLSRCVGHSGGTPELDSWELLQALPSSMMHDQGNKTVLGRSLLCFLQLQRWPRVECPCGC